MTASLPVLSMSSASSAIASRAFFCQRTTKPRREPPNLAFLQLSPYTNFFANQPNMGSFKANQPNVRLLEMNRRTWCQAIAVPGMGDSTVPGASSSSSAPSGVSDNWWERRAPANMRHVETTQELVDEMEAAGDRLVVVEFFGTWCRSCRAMHTKMCKVASEFPHVVFLQVEFDRHKQLCKQLHIRQLPFFHFYRGADGRLDSFAATLTSITKMKAALSLHSTDRCSLGPPAGPGQVLHPDKPLLLSAAAAAVAEAAAAAAKGPGSAAAASGSAAAVSS